MLSKGTPSGVLLVAAGASGARVGALIGWPHEQHSAFALVRAGHVYLYCACKRAPRASSIGLPACGALQTVLSKGTPSGVPLVAAGASGARVRALIGRAHEQHSV